MTSSTSKLKDIKSEYTRELLLKVCDDVFELWPLLEQINMMVRCDEACLWLIRNRFVGQELYEYWVHHKHRSFLSVLSFINHNLEKNTELRPLFKGKDIL